MRVEQKLRTYPVERCGDPAVAIRIASQAGHRGDDVIRISGIDGDTDAQRLH